MMTKLLASARDSQPKHKSNSSMSILEMHVLVFQYIAKQK